MASLQPLPEVSVTAAPSVPSRALPNLARPSASPSSSRSRRKNSRPRWDLQEGRECQNSSSFHAVGIANRQKVARHIQAEYARTTVIAHMSSPTTAGHAGWGRPGSEWDGVHFRTFILGTVPHMRE